MKQEKIKHIWSVLCSTSTTDKDTNNVVLSVMEAIQGDVKYDPENKGFKEHGLVVPVQLEIMTLLKKIVDSKAELSLQVLVVAPDGSELQTIKNVVSIPKDKQRMRVRVRMQGLKIKGNGDYLFKVSIREQSATRFTLVAEIPLEVRIKVQKTSAV